MKFQDYEYKRPDVDELQKSYKEKLEGFENLSLEDQIKTVHEIIAIRSEVDTNATLASIRNSINTKDEFYDKENNFWDENSPKIDSLNYDFYKKLYESREREGLEKEFGKYLFEKIEAYLKSFNPKIEEMLVEENKLVSRYNKLIASAEIDFDGKKNNLSDMVIYQQSKDRQTRIDANKKKYQFFQDNIKEFDEIYDKLIKVRTKMAKELGFENYVEMAYARLSRTDYNSEDVKNYRKQVYETVVPYVKTLVERQKKRLGLDDAKFYDLSIKFLSGNAAPHGDYKWVLNNGKTMYKELGEVPNEFFTFMTENDLFDVQSRPGKKAGGYCTYIPGYRSPFIFANFNRTAHDVEVITHEAGHAIQVYLSRDAKIPEYIWPTYEACEIHSMSMEFLGYPWMELFFEEDAEKFKFQHLEGCVSFLPYGVTIDEFQHYVYENPDVSPEERRAKYREIEKKYRPYIDYDGLKFLENGGFFMQQGHLFWTPFYYIDYTLAQVCAFQFYAKSLENHEKAMEDYLALCRLGGSKPFLQLVEAAGLMNPFKDGTIEKAMTAVKGTLEAIDDSKF